MEIKSFYLNSEGRVERDLTPEKIKEARVDTGHLLWLDIFDPQHESGDFLLHDMGFHPLAVDDCMTASHQPAKVDDYGSHIYLIVHGIDYSSTKDFIETARLSMFIADGTVVTVHRVPLFSLDAIIDRIERDTRLLQRPSSLFSYTILDSLHDNILPALDHLAEVAAELEEASIEAPGRKVLQTILQLKRSAVRIQRTLSPQQRIFNRMSRNEFPLISSEASIYFRDLQDQIIQLDVINMGVRDSADNALATYLSSIGIKQNETMRVLAIVAAIFLPLSLIAGIYGMNFTYMPDTQWRWGYFTVLGFMAVAGLSTFYWLFVRKLGLAARSRHLVRNIKPPIEQVRKISSPINAIVDVRDAVTERISHTVANVTPGYREGRSAGKDEGDEKN